MTVGIQSATRREADEELLLARAQVGLCAVLAAIVLFTLADAKLGAHGLGRTLGVRLAQLALIATAAVALRTPVGRRWGRTLVGTFVCGLYVTSAIAGVLRGAMMTQPITDLAIAFATATTLPWGPWPQLATVGVAGLAIAGGFYAVQGTLAGTSPHMAAGLAVAFLVSVYIAHQLERFRQERDAAADALRRSEERFRALIERGSDVITIVDGTGVIRYESPTVERLLGFRADERVGKRAALFVHPDDLEAIRAAFARSVDGRGVGAECRTARHDGSWCDVEAVCTNLLDHPAIAGIVVNWRDIGERKRAEGERAGYIRELARARDEALASTRAKSMFLANVSHEIRTPMNVIIGMTDMVLDSALTAEQRHDLGRLRTAAIGLLAIINDILDASKIEAGKMTIEVVEMDLRTAIGEATALLGPAAAAKRLDLRTILAADLPARVKGDPVRFRQTLVNLVGNAVKFTDAGSIAVEAGLVRRTATHAVVRVSVRDTGIGIAPDRQATIFDSFAQGDDSTTRVYGGTGLGLAICRQLVTLMAGRMGLESTPGAGSTFWFELTMESCSSAAAA